MEESEFTPHDKKFSLILHPLKPATRQSKAALLNTVRSRPETYLKVRVRFVIPGSQLSAGSILNAPPPPPPPPPLKIKAETTQMCSKLTDVGVRKLIPFKGGDRVAVRDFPEAQLPQ